jgi:arylsulfatase A-like enzyme
MARRLAERGVRFIELIDSGASNNWDSHHDMAAHGPRAQNVDQAIAGLLTDLKQRGMLDDTLVVWTTEFGRTPNRDDTAPEGSTGRGHQATAFSSWLAGGGVKPGMAYGVTDEYGKDVVEKPCHVHDLHATILHLLGIDHERLTYRHAGRDFRLTDVEGAVVREILG